ncbi:MAG TPA: hypothetical protein PLA94_20775, partial [Myxococcota bacterium]|nr:hypothetical protein [Myxococcota bacterium]HND32447.1 hypothetical protein [Myxococcota bacterium]
MSRLPWIFVGILIGFGLAFLVSEEGGIWLPGHMEGRVRVLTPIFSLAFSASFGLAYAKELKQSRQLELRSYWGGLGGTGGGVSISPAVAHLAMAIFFGGVSAVQFVKIQEAPSETAAAGHAAEGAAAGSPAPMAGSPTP